VAALVDQHCDQASWLAEQLRAGGLEVLNRVVLNQVLVRCGSDAETARVRETVLATGAGWFGNTVWQGRPAFRLSLSSWRTAHEDVAGLAEELVKAARA
jgi:aromatic-L-amino-acid decarboxylase